MKLTAENKLSCRVKRFVKDIRLFTNTIKQAVKIMVDSGVDATYDTQDTDNGCDIYIKVRYKEV